LQCLCKKLVPSFVSAFKNLTADFDHIRRPYSDVHTNSMHCQLDDKFYVFVDEKSL
jgi:hypothetical protein